MAGSLQMQLVQESSKNGPPYMSPVALSGGLPTADVDIAICSVLAMLYLYGGVSFIRLIKMNSKKQHKFLLIILMIQFCMSRVVTCILRIVWSKFIHNIRLAIAAQIFVAAGILVVYVINMELSKRCLRAFKPSIGWSPIVKIVYTTLYSLVVCCLIMVITMTIITYYTLNQHTRTIASWIQRGAITYLLVIAVVPLVVLALTFAPPHLPIQQPFGTGRNVTKLATLLVGTCLCTLIAGFRAGTTWMPVRMATNPAWYHTKPAFYCFSFVPEIIVIYVYLIVRIDKRFHVPDGSSKMRSYAKQPEQRPVGHRPEDIDLESLHSETKSDKDRETI
ncbi:hypothetical protein K470DRAFT_264088 [Piedraia hortae CBS 480.64]|uniref:Uncharacterized protein n=1 Tax=Piedraia hortae CBS 480.64 TaxID=1314780 RepID=A0A6A7C1S5_9PEZI|nr:hypothetical protein K470DRAFT_264088 [Piedraia hortae CBS 480.64]